MEVQRVYNKTTLITMFSRSIEKLFNENNLHMKVNDSYSIKMELKNFEIKLDVSEKTADEIDKDINQKIQKKTIAILVNKVANIEIRAAMNDAQLIDKNKCIAEMVSNDIAKELEISSLKKSISVLKSTVLERSTNFDEKVTNLESQAAINVAQLVHNKKCMAEMMATDVAKELEISSLKENISELKSAALERSKNITEMECKMENYKREISTLKEGILDLKSADLKKSKLFDKNIQYITEMESKVLKYQEEISNLRNTIEKPKNENSKEMGNAELTQNKPTHYRLNFKSLRKITSSDLSS